jgi:hypothetical protein
MKCHTANFGTFIGIHHRMYAISFNVRGYALGEKLSIFFVKSLADMT